MFQSITLIFAFIAVATAHTAAWAEKGMYCAYGKAGEHNINNNLPVGPLYNLTKENWWFQHDRGCDASPPPAGEFLEIRAGGSFTVELAHNRANTDLAYYNGSAATEWPDGKEHPEDMKADPSAQQSGCVDDGALHTNNQSTAAGTAWAISYESELSKVTMENLVVFSVLEHTPWKRIATYQVPKAMPACPKDGCICAWLWVPYHCGQSNLYMQGYKCEVTNATSTTPIPPAKPPVFCKYDQNECLSGPKQMIAFNQLTGNNVNVTSMGPNGLWDTPMYNKVCGFKSGPQEDIFKAA